MNTWLDLLITQLVDIGSTPLPKVYKLGGAPRGEGCLSPPSDWDSQDNDCAGNTVQHGAPRLGSIFRGK